MAKGRLVFPVASALAQAAVTPFPRLAFATSRCGACGASGVGYAVFPTGTGGFNAQHEPSCPVPQLEQTARSGGTVPA
jgi:hypothetical protein